jgi:hypothetical protein
MKMKSLIHSFFVFSFFLPVLANAQSRWSEQRANEWYRQQPWLMGADYLPATAINQLEMFQAESFDESTLRKELELAQRIGFNTLRVYLHDLLWQQDASGFKKRLDTFLSICSAHGIKPVLVFFDSCWDPYPKTGQQRAPQKGLHNSGWVQSPGAAVLRDPAQHVQLENYVRDVVKTFQNDPRILCWDVWNEPDNTNDNSYRQQELPNKVAIVNQLLPHVFRWVREEKPQQPVTAGLWTWWRWSWHPDSVHRTSETEKIILNNSDIITFHHYGKPTDFETLVQHLKRYNRPLICTEYLARGEGNTPITILPIAKKYHIGMINWGFVDGKEQTKFPWDSWEKRYEAEPALWHHVLFRADLTPYKPEEIALIKKLRSE